MVQRLGTFVCCVAVAALACVALASAAEAGWLPPVALSEPAQHTGAPHVVLDSGGNATAVWDRWNGSENVVESAFRPAGESWEAPVVISAGYAQSPRIGVDGAGDVAVVFEHWTEAGTIIQSVDRPAGGSWSTPVDVSEPIVGSNPEPWVAADTAGDTIAVWKQGEVIQAASRPVGEAWEAPIPVSGGGSYVPQAAMNATGDATVVWMHNLGGHYVVQSAYLPAGGEWGAPTLVSQPGEEGGNPKIALGAAGDTLVAWRGEDEGTEYVRTAYRPVGEPWEAPTDASNAGEQVQEIRDAVDPAGNAIVAWSGSATGLGYNIVHAAFRPAGGAWEAAVELSATGGNGFPADVVFDQSGNAAIVWQRATGSEDLIEASYRPAEGEWEEAAQLSESGKESFDPVVVLDAPGDETLADGDATAAWVSEGALDCEGPKGKPEPCGGGTVQAAGYDPEGLEAGLQLPPTAEVGEPVSMSVATGIFGPSIEFGDGEHAAAHAIHHTYSAPGVYRVSATGAEVLGYPASSERTIEIVPAGEGGKGGEPPPPSDPTNPPSGPGGGTTEQVTTGGGQETAGGAAGPTGGATNAKAGPTAACTTARAALRSERRRLKRVTPHDGGQAALRKALRRVAAAC
jgi:hypothetical protein